MAKPYIPHDGPLVTRDEAIEKGLRRFFTGAPCPNGHIAEFYTGNRWCATCSAEHAAAWYQENKAHCSVKMKAWRERNPERARANRDAWFKANPIRYAELGKAWKKAHPEKVKAFVAAYNRANLPKLNARNAAREAAKIRATPIWANRAAIEDIYRECARISADTGVVHHVDHKYPLRSNWVCGLHCEANLQIIDATTNKRKGNRNEPSSDGSLPPQGDLFWSLAA